MQTAITQYIPNAMKKNQSQEEKNSINSDEADN